MFDLANFKMSEMIECGAAMRELGKKARSMEESASRIVSYLYNQFIDQNTGKRAFALVRFFKTHPYGDLDEELQGFAQSLMGKRRVSRRTKCLVLLATVGENPLWNSRKNSKGHKAIPLPSEQVVSQIPMISQLVYQLGLKINDVIKPNPALLVELEQKTFNVFYVSETAGSPFVPAQQDFVIPYGIKSALGFGGLFPNGDLFAAIMFSKVFVSRDVADMFKTLSLSTKMAILPFWDERIFS